MAELKLLLCSSNRRWRASYDFNTPDADGTHISIFEILQLECSYVGDSLCLIIPSSLRLQWKWHVLCKILPD